MDRLVFDKHNANKGTDRGRDALARSIERYGTGRSVLVDKEGRLIAGNKTAEQAERLGLELVVVPNDGTKLVVVQRTDLDLEHDAAARELAIADNRVAELDLAWDAEVLREQLADDALDLGDLFTDDEAQQLLADLAAAATIETPAGPVAASPEPAPVAPVTEVEAPAPPPEPITKLGDVWHFGAHRLLCGDTTDAEAIARLLAGDVVSLIHADPPYGMGKEKDGVANDNLYGDTQDAFQLAWWRAWTAHAVQNMSAYVWGNAEELWRLWWRGGLRDEPGPLHLRNEIVWDKGSGFGMASAGQHSFSPATERCLFIMRGQQFLGNQNKDDYWPGYEPLRSWLDAEREKAGWTTGDVNKLTGTHMAGHWFTRSQFFPISEKHYNALQAAAEGRAFVTPYDAIFGQLFPDVRSGGNEYRRGLAEQMREARSWFDNTHDIMTDVWRFPRVHGEERFGHATPKPVAMAARAIASSCEPRGLVAVPFGGTGPEFVAAEQLDRRCVGIELNPAYCDVIVRRWELLTGRTAQRVPRAA